MKNEYSYVEWIQNHKIDIRCYDDNKTVCLKFLNARKKIFNSHTWVIYYRDDNELIKIISSLRDNGFMFAFDEHGWCPSGIFQYFREKGLLFGKFTEIFWRGTQGVGIREL